MRVALPRPAVLVLTAALCCWAAVASAEMGDFAADKVFGQSDLSHSIGLPIGTATFAEPRGVAVDHSVTPNRIYVADSFYSRVLGWSDADAMANGSPADLVIGQLDFASFGCNGEPSAGAQRPPATAANLCRPYGIDVDSAGNLYVADRDNCRVLVYDSPFANDAVADLEIGSCGLATPNTLRYPLGVAVGTTGNVFIADNLNRRVLEYDGPLSSTDLLPDRVFLQPDFTSGFLDGTHFPTDVALDDDGVLYVATSSRVLRFDDPLNDNTISATYGTDGCNTQGCTYSGCQIDTEGPETTCMPIGVATAPTGALYVGDAGNNRVLGFDQPHTSPSPARVYGQPDFGGASGLFHDECNDGGASAESLCTFVAIRLTLGGTFEVGVGLDVDDAGRLYVADTLNHRVLRYAQPTVDSVADDVLGHLTMDDIRRPLPTIEGPHVALNSSQLVSVDSELSRILLYPSTELSGAAVPVGVIGQPDFDTSGCNSGGLGAASLCQPSAAIAESFGPLWVADTGNHRVLRFDYPWLQYDSNQHRYVVKKTADAVYGQPHFVSSACNAGAAGLCSPRGLAFDASRNLYVADSGNHRIVRYDDPMNDATADVVMGQPDFSGNTCNNGGRSADSLCDPRGLDFNWRTGNLLVADTGNNRVLVYQQVEQFPGGAEFVFGQAGSFTSGACGSGASGLCAPSDVAHDTIGQTIVADTGNNRVLQYDLPFSDSVADRVFGQPDLSTNICNYGGVSESSLCAPVSVGVYSGYGDKFFIGDAGNQRIVKIDAPYCAETWDMADKIAGGSDASGPWKTKIKVKRRGSRSDLLKIVGKITLWEDDGYADFSDEPLITISSPAGVEYRERVPYLSCTIHGETDRCKTQYLKNERSQGIDDYKIVDAFRFEPRQHSKVRFRTRAVSLDLSSFAASQASLEMQFGSVCFASTLQCKHSASRSICK